MTDAACVEKWLHFWIPRTWLSAEEKDGETDLGALWNQARKEN
jgi:hypothetical protein